MNECLMSNKGVRVNVAAFNDKLRWNFVEEMAPNTPSSPFI